MSNILNNNLFNQKSPFESIINLTNCHQFLKESARKSFLVALHSFFSRQAFQDETVGGLKYPDRLNGIDLPSVYRIMKHLSFKDCEAAYQQLIANISKTSGNFFTDNTSGDAVYQICMSQDCGSKNLVFWGWIPKRYVDGSDLIKKYLNTDKGILDLTGLDNPSILVAIQRLQYVINHAAGVDLSLESLLHLYCFSEKYAIMPLKNELVKLFESIDLNKNEITELEELLSEYQFIDAESLKEFLLDKSNANRTLIRHHEDVETSAWFDHEQPFRSIERFTGRCCTLPPEEFPKFLSAVDDFFSTAAFQGIEIEVPKKFKDRFVHVDLPLMIENLQSSSPSERKRFIASIQKVTGLAVLQLKRRDQLHLIQNTYGDESLPNNHQTTWIAVQDVDQTKLQPKQNVPKMEGYVDANHHAIPVHGKDTLPWITVDDTRSLAYEAPERLIHLLSLSLDYNVETWIEKTCDALHKASETPAKWSECSQHLIPLLEREDVCQTLRKYNIPNLEPALGKLDSKQLWDLFVFRVGHKLENMENVQALFLKLEHNRQIQVVERAEILTLIAKSTFNLVHPQEHVDTLCLALDLSLDDYVQKASVAFASAQKSEHWKGLSTALSQVQNRKNVRMFLEKIPPLDPAYEQLNSEELWTAFSFQTKRDDIKETFFALTHGDQVKVLSFIDQLITGNRLPNKPDELVDLLRFAQILSFETCLEKVIRKTSDLKNSDKWKEFSTQLACHLEDKGLYTVVLESEIALLQPTVSSLNEGQRDFVLRFNMQKYGATKEDASNVIEKTFGGNRYYARPTLVRFKMEATPPQLEAINTCLVSYIADKIEQKENGTLRECCAAVLRELTQPGSLLTETAIAACVMKHANPYHQPGLQGGIYRQLISHSMHGVFLVCEMDHLYQALCKAHAKSFVASSIEDLFDSEIRKDTKMSKTLTELIELFVNRDLDPPKYKVEEFKKSHYLFDEQIKYIAKFWNSQGASIIHKDRTLTKEQVWNALCKVYGVELYLLMDHFDTNFKGKSTAKSFLVDRFKYYKVHKKYNSTNDLQALEAHDVLENLLQRLPRDLNPSNALKKYLISLTTTMLAIWINGNEKSNWITALPEKLEGKESIYTYRYDIPTDEQVLEAAHNIQGALCQVESPLALEIKQIIWERFCKAYDVDVILMMDDVSKWGPIKKESSKEIFGKIIAELRKDKYKRTCENPVEYFLDNSQVGVESAKNFALSVKMNSDREYATGRLKEISEKFLTSIEIWINQEEEIQRFLKKFPTDQTKARKVLENVIRRMFRSSEQQDESESQVSSETILICSNFLLSQDTSIRSEGKKLTTAEIWKQFCQIHHGDLRLLEEGVRQGSKEETPLKDLLLKLLNKYNRSEIGYLCKDLEHKEIEALINHLNGILKTTHHATEPLKKYLKEIIGHLEVFKQINPFKKSENIWDLVTYILDKKQDPYSDRWCFSQNYCNISLNGEEEQSVIQFFQNTLKLEENSHEMIFLRELWEGFCKQSELDLGIIYPEIEKKFCEQQEIEALVWKALKTGLVWDEYKNVWDGCDGITENQILAIDGFVRETMQNNVLVSKDLMTKANKFIKKLCHQYYFYQINQQFENQPEIKSALVQVLHSIFFENVSVYKIKDSHPLSGEQIEQATKIWKDYAQTPENCFKPFLNELWNVFCRVYDADYSFVKGAIDAYFEGQTEITSFLNVIVKRYAKGYVLLNSDYEAENVLEEVRKHKIGIKEAKAIRCFLQDEFPKTTCVSQSLGTKVKQIVQLMQEVENIANVANRFEVPEIREAVTTVIEALVLNKIPELIHCHKTNPLTLLQINQSLEILENLEEDIHCLNFNLSPETLKKSFCSAYSKPFVESEIKAQFYEKPSCENFLLKVIEQVNMPPSKYLEPSELEKIFRKTQHEYQISSEDAQLIKNFLGQIMEKVPFLKNDEQLLMTLTTLTSWISVQSERQDVANHYLGEAFEGNPVRKAISLVIEQLLHSDKGSFGHIKEAVPLKDSQKKEVAEFVQSSSQKLIYQGREYTPNQIWSAFCQAYNADTVLMPRFDFDFPDYALAGILTQLLKDYYEYPSLYGVNDNSNKFSGKISSTLIEKRISSDQAKSIKAALEQCLNSEALLSDKLRDIIQRMNHYFGPTIESLQTMEKFSLEFKFKDNLFLKSLVGLLWLPDVEYSIESFNERKDALLNSWNASDKIEGCVHFLLSSEKKIKTWCLKSNIPSQHVPTAIRLFGHIEEFKLFNSTYEFNTKVNENYPSGYDNREIRDLLKDCIHCEDLSKLDSIVGNNKPTKEQAKSIQTFLEKWDVKWVFEHGPFPAQLHERLLSKMKGLQSSGWGWFS